MFHLSLFFDGCTSAKSGLHFLFLTSSTLLPCLTCMIFQKLLFWRHWEPPPHQGIWPFLSIHSFWPAWNVWYCWNFENFLQSGTLLRLFLTFIGVLVYAEKMAMWPTLQNVGRIKRGVIVNMYIAISKIHLAISFTSKTVSLTLPRWLIYLNFCFDLSLDVHSSFSISVSTWNNKTMCV